MMKFPYCLPTSSTTFWILLALGQAKEIFTSLSTVSLHTHFLSLFHLWSPFSLPRIIYHHLTFIASWVTSNSFFLMTHFTTIHLSEGMHSIQMLHMSISAMPLLHIFVNALTILSDNNLVIIQSQCMPLLFSGCHFVLGLIL